MQRKMQVRLGASEKARFCPYCGSKRIQRSRRKTVAERTILRWLGIHPYRCARCDERYFTIGRMRHAEPPASAPHQASADAPEPVEQAKTTEKSRAATA
jgi:DNA-directed RNA polymerase subunit RPC12/RpoP